jgi:hypothetical protein
MAFDLPGLVGSVHFDLQGACVRFNTRFADSAFQIPLSRGHGAHVGTTQLTESLLLVTRRSLRDQLLIFSTAENHFHPICSSTDKDSGFASRTFAYKGATPGPEQENPRLQPFPFPVTVGVLPSIAVWFFQFFVVLS